MLDFLDKEINVQQQTASNPSIHLKEAKIILQIVDLVIIHFCICQHQINQNQTHKYQIN